MGAAHRACTAQSRAFGLGGLSMERGGLAVVLGVCLRGCKAVNTNSIPPTHSQPTEQPLTRGGFRVAGWQPANQVSGLRRANLKEWPYIMDSFSVTDPANSQAPIYVQSFSKGTCHYGIEAMDVKFGKIRSSITGADVVLQQSREA